MDVLYIETPTNPLMLEFDIAHLAKLAHAKVPKSWWTILSIALSINVSDWKRELILSYITKYLAGHNDVLGWCHNDVDQLINSFSN